MRPKAKLTNKVLLIEDDNNMLTLLSKLLSYEGLDVAQVENDDSLDQILDAVRQEAPAVILMDVHLRLVNGFDLLRSIRQDGDLKGTRVIISSGMDFRQRCKEEGADGFVLKPFMPEELIGKIKQYLEPVD